MARAPAINLYQTKGKKSLVRTYRSRKPILAIPVTKETSIPIIKFMVITEASEATCGNLARAAPKIMGVDNKKENLADFSLVNPINNPVVMVIPERETPGIIARAWDIPINILVPIRTSVLSTFLTLLRSAQYRRMPININITAIKRGDLKTVSAFSCNKNPATAPGTLATTKYQNIRPSAVWTSVIPFQIN
jgi:hypothetical protein